MSDISDLIQHRFSGPPAKRLLRSCLAANFKTLTSYIFYKNTIIIAEKAFPVTIFSYFIRSANQRVYIYNRK